MSDGLLTGVKHTHTLLVTIFILHLIVKAVMLFTNSPSLAKYKAKTRVIFDMIIPTLFVVSGLYLLSYIGMGNIGGWFHLKLTLVVIGIPIAIIGFSKNSKLLAGIGILIFIYVFVLAFTKTPLLF